MICPSKSLSRRDSTALAPASPPPTMTKVVELAMIAAPFGLRFHPTRAGLTHQVPQRERVADRVAAQIIVEIQPHVPSVAVPFGDPVGPPTQLVVRVAAGVDRIRLRTVHPDVHQIGGCPGYARQAGAAHYH